jgi:hypothetical protein
MQGAQGQADALRAQLAATLHAADAALALRLAFEQLAERTRTAMLVPQLALAIDGELRQEAVDRLRGELTEIEGMRDCLRRLAGR